MSTAAYQAAYQASHREEITAQRAGYYKAHREEIAAHNAAHCEERAAYQAAYYAAHREERAASNAAYNAVHREEKATYQAAYVKANPEKGATHKALRRARKLGNSIGLPLPDFEAILAEFGMVCHICGLEIITKADLHMDHVIPLAKGGPHSAGNIRPSHARCNRKKGSKPWPLAVA